MSAIANPKTTPAYAESQTTAWLAWLAYQLKRHDQTVFLIENLQPTWLSTERQRRNFVLFIEFVTIFLTLLIVALEVIIVLVGLDSGLGVDLIIASFFIIPFTLILLGLWQVVKRIWLSVRPKSKRNRFIIPVESIKFSWVRVVAAAFISFAGIFLLIFVFAMLLESGLGEGLLMGLIFGGIVGAGPSVLVGLYWGITPGNIELRDRPNQGYFSSLKISGFTLAAVILLLVILTILGFNFDFGGITFVLIFGVLFLPFIGWIAVLRLGGSTVLRHLTLRFILYRQGHIPLNYARFLNYAADELNFLQKVGGGYIFVHRYLLEHFAAIEEEKRTAAAPASSPT